MTPFLAVAVLVIVALVILALVPMALHRLVLLRRARAPLPPPPTIADFEEHPESGTPRVLVQLPVFNEAAVVERLIDHAARLDWPADHLRIQLLDDSTDGTIALAAARVEHWRARGVKIEHLRRPDRRGFKAGALAYGLERDSGEGDPAEFVLILDADFLPDPGLVRALVPYFGQSRVGMVQARWDHLNRERSLLTRAQALFLDAHFLIEQRGRYATGLWFNFNGTAGMWRRSCLDDAGGWEADTLTEDLDLSYRAQMAGWDFIFDPEVGVPAELPERVGSFETQQRRWAQGGVQTGRKLLGPIWRGGWSLRRKVEATFHLFAHLAHPLTLTLGLLLFPAAAAREALGLGGLWAWADLIAFGLATLPFLLFYGRAGRLRARSFGRLCIEVPAALAVGVGLSVPVGRAVIRGLRAGVDDPFERTAKCGGRGQPARYPGSSRGSDTLFKGVLGGITVAAAGVAAWEGYWGAVPFLLLFACGWLGLAFGGLRGGEPAAAQTFQTEKAERNRPEEPGHARGGGPLSGACERPEAPVSDGREAA